MEATPDMTETPLVNEAEPENTASIAAPPAGSAPAATATRDTGAARDTGAMRDPLDVIVVGGGPAGLAAALMLGRARRRVLVIDAGQPRNRFADRMHGVPGFEGVPPGEYLERVRAEVAGYGCVFVDGEVETVSEPEAGIGGVVRVSLRDGTELRARALIVATGLTDELPGIPGLAERWGTSVLHCPYCHGWEVRDQSLGVIARSPMSLHQVQLVRQWSDRVTLFSAGAGDVDDATTRRLRARGIAVIESPVVELLGEASGGSGADAGRLTGVRTADGGVTEIDAVFTFGASTPHDHFLAGLGLERAETPMGSFLAVDAVYRTSAPRIWAVGNVVDPSLNVPMSAGVGSFTGASVNWALVEEEFELAEASEASEGSEVHDSRSAGDGDPGPWPEVAPAEYWEERYGESDRIWSGRVNRVLADVAASLEPGRALDLGCGEGGDVVWLARQGWKATGIDISRTAIGRAEAAARAAGLGEAQAGFRVADLSGLDAGERFDLVSASFLHSPVELPRERILRLAAEHVAPGGHLLITAHAAPPPWAKARHAHEHEHAHDGQDPGHPSFPTPDEEIASLGLDDAEWEILLAETRDREATGPDGETATLADGIVLLRRR
ncbi:Ferredoxin--NADP reductase [Leucobacter soli]|uniref:Ferredoxin--NADP reductase n=1 Tax=Leucobacter soli TaxID=2812850 RepID=A0A916K0Z2_9MICO|nr:FAD-dependent oxidoreductase [Leucobacter soli]CAG7616504.1 Ferredoxin--NADP reductase [Leucobacter soli]